MSVFDFFRSRRSSVSARVFSGAVANRFNEDFVGTAIRTNNDLRASLDKLRVASRELAKNNGDYRKYLRMCERNIVGATGIQLQMAARTLSGGEDAAANRLICERWQEFAKFGNCTADKRQSFRGLLKQIVRTHRIDGEVFLRRLPFWSGNKFSYAFQLLDAAACPTTLNFITHDGNRVVMGVELNAWDEPIAYYFATRSGSENLAMSYEPVFVGSAEKDSGYYYRFPAEAINHYFDREFVGQVRGFPFGQAAIQEMQLLNAYFYTELVAAKAASNKIGALINEEAPTIYGGRGQKNNANAEPQIVDTAPGSFDLLTGKWKIETYDPQHPSANFPPYIKAMNRKVANGLDVAYNGFANDLESVNFSSMRGGVLDERDAWMDSQETLIEAVISVEFSRWLAVQLGSGALPGFSPADQPRLDRAVWLARRWQWVDPRNDAEANILQVALGATTPQDIAANLGNDFEDNMEKNVQAADKLKKVAELLTAVAAVKQAFSPAAPAAESAEADSAS